MKKLLALLAASSVLSTQATVLTFDDLTGSGTMPIGYAGLDWDPQWVYYDSPQTPYFPSSGATRLYTHNFGGYIKFSSDVDFTGSWVASANVGQDMYWEGWDDGVKVGESAHISGGAATWLAAGFSSVDEIRFVSTTFNHFIIDDLTYDGDLPGVPEVGSTFALLGVALAGLRMARRK